MFEQALQVCPDELWEQSLWRNQHDPSEPAVASQFWYLAYHTLFWTDLYLFGTVDGFTPPTPFTLDELDPAGVFPEHPYTKQELQQYLTYTQEKYRIIIAALPNEQAMREVIFPWSKGQPIRYFELLLYTMRHIQEHAAQLSMFLGQHGLSASLGWIARR